MMKISRKAVRKITLIKRRRYNHSLHRLARKECISPGCLFYMKEYGPHSNVARVIVKEALAVLLLTSLISSVAGIGLEGIRSHFAVIIPIIILLPALNNAIGGFGTIVSSKFTELIYTGRVSKNWWKSDEVTSMLKFVYVVGFISALYISALAYIASALIGAVVSLDVILKLMLASVLTSMILLGIVFLIAVYAGLKIYQRKEDPNNFLIPLTTAIADFTTILIYSGIIILIF
ncbi:MAG: magnesium transporter [Candidatus Aenigmarchaeota archaeon]|nr:magnesium transporter [Candidatus Aenigmarchaeota archaeon]